MTKKKTQDPQINELPDKDYPYLRAWHEDTGSSWSYTQSVLAKARSEHAPDRAVYYNQFGKFWVTAEDIRNESARIHVLKRGEQIANS